MSNKAKPGSRKRKLSTDAESTSLTNGNEDTVDPTTDPTTITSTSTNTIASYSATGTHDCSICMEPRQDLGEHETVSLSCGHLFGKRCLIDWFHSCEYRCPQCNGHALIQDVRTVSCTNLGAVDFTEERSTHPKKRRKIDDSESATNSMLFGVTLYSIFVNIVFGVLLGITKP